MSMFCPTPMQSAVATAKAQCRGFGSIESLMSVTLMVSGQRTIAPSVDQLCYLERSLLYSEPSDLCLVFKASLLLLHAPSPFPYTIPQKLSFDPNALMLPFPSGEFDEESREHDNAKLEEHEIPWRERYDYLYSRGYALRPRYRPDWVASWKASGLKPIECEDSVGKVVCWSLTPSKYELLKHDSPGFHQRCRCNPYLGR